MVIPQSLEAYVKDTHTAYGTDKEKPLQYTTHIPLPKEVEQKFILSFLLLTQRKVDWYLATS